MNETEIREQLREAIGEAKYPPTLTSSTIARLKRREPEQHPRAIGLVAAIIALAVIAALLAPRVIGWRPTVPAGPRASVQSPAPGPSLLEQIPPGDFEAAGLSTASALVTPFQLEATSTQGKLTLIGAYADPARTVLLFRTTPDFRLPLGLSVSDDQGLINASSNGGGGLTGEYYFSLDAGPHAGPNGFAHLVISVQGFRPSTFSLMLKVQPSTTLAIVPSQFDMGTWKVTIAAGA